MSTEIFWKESDLAGRCAELEAALQAQDDKYKTHLIEIHRQLRKQEELVHILDDAAIAIIFDGLKRYTGAAVVKEMVEKKTRRKTPISASDL